MKKFPFFAPFIIAAIGLSCFSCKSAPEATPSPGSPPASGEAPAPVSSAELTAAIARAEEARQRTIDFESPAYFPSDWDAAEAQYVQAGHSVSQSAEALRISIATYEAAADAFDSLFMLTVPLYAQAKEDEIMALRDDLIAHGVRDSEPEYFTYADETALAALDQYEAQDYYAARDTAHLSIMMYQTLSNAYDALLMRDDITEREFESYDPVNFDRADILLSDAVDAYEDGDILVAHEKAHEALRHYHTVLAAGWAAYAELRASFASAERQAALDIKANIATRELFSEADSSYRTAGNLFDSRNFQDAATQFINAEALFVIASSSATEKRRNAADAIREAYEKIEESDETALQAEILLEGGSE